MTMRGLHLASAALGVIALVGLTSQQAHAGAVAFIDLNVTNFELSSGGTELANGSTIDVTSNNPNTFATHAKLDRVTDSGAGPGNPAPAGPAVLTVTTPPTLFQAGCVGSNCAPFTGNNLGTPAGQTAA